jgi:hypothetical protein
MSGYAFNTNCAWHFVDALLKRKYMPEYNLDLNNGPDDLTPAVRARFDWDSITEAAQYFDQNVIDSAGTTRRRFQGSYLFNQQTTLTAILEQIVSCCRSKWYVDAGKVYLVCDKPRPSYFIFSREHIMPGSFAPSDQTINSAANRVVAKFRDLLVPVAAQILSITCPDGRIPLVTTVDLHPFTINDYLVIGGTDTPYDGNWETSATLSDITDYSFRMVSKGSNFPNIGQGGSIGLRDTRFMLRAPGFNHDQHQYASGAVGLGIPLQKNPTPVEHDYGTSTFDQASRLAKYERDNSLGANVAPYIAPRALNFSVPMFARDINGNLAINLRQTDRVTVDDTASFAYQGDYKIAVRGVTPPNAQLRGGASLQHTAAADSGVIEFSLEPYEESAFYDQSDPTEASWDNVPGSDPGNDNGYVLLPLSAGGVMSFWTDTQDSGTQFNLPSIGFNPANLLTWCSPGGYIEKGHTMHGVNACNATNRVLQTQYSNGSDYWLGATNYAALTWRAGATELSVSAVGAMTYVVATLLGGEQICFGYGVVPDGTTIALPTGFTSDKVFAMASPASYSEAGNEVTWIESYVDAALMAHLNYRDYSGYLGHGNATVFVFAWQNNMGTALTTTIPGGKWISFSLSNGDALGFGFAGNVADSSPFTLASPFTVDQLHSYTTTRSCPSVAHHAHGVRASYVDINLLVHLAYSDESANIWTGNADCFGVCYGQGLGSALATAAAAGTTSTAGSTPSSTGYTVTSGTFTAYLPVNGSILRVVASPVVVTLANGATVTYTGRVMSVAASGGESFIVYVYDPTMAGGSVAFTIIPDSGTVPSGQGYMQLGTFDSPQPGSDRTADL